MENQAAQIFSDWLSTLPEAEKSFAMRMHAYALGKGARLRLYRSSPAADALFQYYYKGMRVMWLRPNAWRHTPLDIAVPYGLKGGRLGDIDCFVAACDGEPDRDGLLAYIIGNICCCDRCGNNAKAAARCGGQWKEIAGARRKTAGCHNEITKWKAPKTKLAYTQEDIHWLERLLDIKVKQILRYNE